jgi:hypothetical protein
MNNPRGGIKPYICILLLIVSVYLGYKFSIPYYRYYALKSEAKNIARLELRSVPRYKKLIYEKAESLKIPIELSDIYISVREDSVEISISWQEEVDLLGYYTVVLNFDLEVEE